jgi:uncharacterized protein YggE
MCVLSAEKGKEKEEHTMSNRKMLHVALLTVALLVVVTGCSNAANASSATPPNRTITVVGAGKASGTPDVAYVTVGVETRDDSVQVAVDDNAEIMNDVLDALKALGIADADLQTSNYSVYTERVTPRLGPEAEETEGDLIYQVRNQVSVKVRDLDILEDVLDEAVSAGANSIYGIQFGVDDPSELQAEARADAVEDAKARADSLAELNGVSVGDVMHISEVITGPGPMLERAAYAVPQGAAAPIEVGELEVHMSVQITYAIH